MPTYEYKCDKCNYVFEEFQSINDEPLRECPKCGGGVQRLIGAGAGLIFKGSGFYLTDYKKSNSSPSTTNSETKPGHQTTADTSRVKPDKSTKQKIDSQGAKKPVTAKRDE